MEVLSIQYSQGYVNQSTVVIQNNQENRQTNQFLHPHHRWHCLFRPYISDEMNQWELTKLYSEEEPTRFFVSDVLNKGILPREQKSIDYAIYSGATKIFTTL